MDNVLGFDFTNKIEDMTPEQMEARIKAGYEYKIPHKIVPIPYIGGKEKVQYKYPEMVALCPATGILDLYTVYIRMVPDKSIPELKSLKFYLMDYKDLPISHEHLCDKLYKEIMKVVKPLQLYIKVETAVRGGIYTDIEKGEISNEINILKKIDSE